MPAITVLLASYQPNPLFLHEQINSICEQIQCEPFSILIRDDGSSNEVLELLWDLAKSDSRIHFFTDELGSLGAKGNFAQLLHSAHDKQVDYVLFADQDDVWANDKIAQLYTLMEEMEVKYDDAPIMIYSDMSVVDYNLKKIAPSFMNYMNMYHKSSHALQVLLAQNFVTGCTMMFNRALMNIAYPIPPEALLHDWWIALCAAALGRVEYIDQALVQYRQHGHNTVGAKHIRNLINPFKHNIYQHWRSGQVNLAKSMAQADALARRIKAYDVTHPDLPLIESYAALLSLPPHRRLIELHRLGVHAQSSLRHMLLLTRLCGLRRVSA
jgi:glycosyltransferase involved in cell wall biosynthesis